MKSCRMSSINSNMATLNPLRGPTVGADVKALGVDGAVGVGVEPKSSELHQEEDGEHMPGPPKISNRMAQNLYKIAQKLLFYIHWGFR